MMHGLMRSIGFKYINTKKALEEVLMDATINPTEQRVISINNEGENVVELRKYYSPGMGIALRGYFNEENEFMREYYYPFVEGDDCTEYMEVNINRHMGRTSFAGACDDIRMGVTMIFYLQNSMDFIDYLLTEKYSTVRAPLSLTGLSPSGTILLPVNKSRKQISRIKKATKLHNEWINAAKDGDESAIENLTMEDFDLYTQATKRIKNEDIFSVVDSTFMPYGVECDHYMVMGDILEIEEMRNSISGELIYFMTLMCNDIRLNVVVNSKDLVGEPEVGRRYKGSIWLQGTIKFDKKKH